MERTVLHCDMNNFYASVECMLDPSLKKYPVAVCGSVEERHGIVLAKNYKAKAFKVKTGDAVWEAKEKCPDLVVVPPHYDEYIKYSKKAKEIYSRYTDLIEPYGMDECWLDVTGSKIAGIGKDIAYKIKETIKFELGLTISAGVSYNKIFAKLGSDMKKPDAVTVINKENYKNLVWTLPVEDLLGVGYSTKRFMDKFAVSTIGDLANLPSSFLEEHLGKNGLKIWQYANGLDTSPVAPMGYEFPVKSVGHGTTVRRDLKDNDDVWKVVLELCQNIGHRLRLCGKMATGVSIYVRDNELFSKVWQMKLGFPTQSPLVIAREAMELFKKRFLWEKDIRSFTVSAIDLVPLDSPFQVNFFCDAKKQEKQEKLDSCVENLRRRFGNSSLKNAVLLDNSLMEEERAMITMPTGMIG